MLAGHFRHHSLEHSYHGHQWFFIWFRVNGCGEGDQLIRKIPMLIIACMPMKNLDAPRQSNIHKQ